MQGVGHLYTYGLTALSIPTRFKQLLLTYILDYGLSQFFSFQLLFETYLYLQ